ncbi:MAG: dienelactone hydrolase family protein [Deltaproteobacteria bacterium]
MDLETRTVEFPAADGPMPAYLARPLAVSEPLPAVLVVQEIWGVDGHIEDVARRVAEAGYVAFAPDLFSRGGTRPAPLAHPRMAAAKGFLNSLKPAEWGAVTDPAKRGAVLEKLPDADRGPVAETLAALFGPERMAQMPSYPHDLAQAAKWLRAQPFCRGRKVGAVGFCMGGALAASLATIDPELGGVVCFYGQPPPAEKLPALRAPILGLFGEDDPRLVAQLPAFEQAMKAAGKELLLHVYPNTPHAFFNDTRPSYRPEAARDAWARTLTLFARTLT